MDTYKVNPQVKKALQLNLFTTDIECESVIRKGSQAIFSSQFLEKVTKVTKGKATPEVLDFIKQYIGQFNYVGLDMFTLRYFSLSEDGVVEGVEVQVDPVQYKLIFRKITGLYGVNGVEHVISEKYYA